MSSASVLKEHWARGEPVFGGWAALPCAFGAELMCVPGVDYVCIDQQHGLVEYADMVAMLRAIEGRGVVPVTRVPANVPWIIGKALDAGAQGVVVPMVNNGEEAAAAVAACRYAPKGIRSFGPVRASMVMDTRDISVVGDGVLCFVMVETREAVERIDEIASTPGLDGIYVGPADLALGLGLPPNLDKEEPEHVAAVEKILKACQRHGVVAGIQCGSGKSARKYAERGFGFVTFAKDSNLIPSAMDREVAAARQGASADNVKERGYA
ncbi:HpcH/HpaI aldolase/citrate lyase family protein [Paraburkholderia piptadeniae]|uniref:HpcH/HpaI aldolase/citrate lyase family protein n=1 Tax=Paraburkholderia piptadeniae TaxID=1701573 RepID=A0A1N7SPP5_9BURK|nr:aldolase/citrate lyase family protein [Paraburkholderia piptadeniae]SIT49306.1 HpcH/HpaI aldolase/citrate lyase family protein [Paraburkholderia piptadeniae]